MGHEVAGEEGEAANAAAGLGVDGDGRSMRWSGMAAVEGVDVGVEGVDGSSAVFRASAMRCRRLRGDVAWSGLGVVGAVDVGLREVEDGLTVVEVEVGLEVIGAGGVMEAARWGQWRLGRGTVAAVTGVVATVVGCGLHVAGDEVEG